MQERPTVETIKSLFELENNIKDKTLFDKTLADIGITYDEYKNRANGIELEYDFALTLYSLGICKHVERFDEELSSLFGEYTCDFRVTFISGKQIMLEIKSTTEDVFKISSGNLQKRIDFAKENNLDLYFAIYIFNHWLCYSSDYLKNKNGKITIDDFRYSIMDSLFNTAHYEISNIDYVSTYKESKKNTMGVIDKEYGNLISETASRNGKRLYKTKHVSDFPVLFYLSAVRDRASFVGKEQNGDITVVKSQLKESHLISDFELIIHSVHKMEMSSGKFMNSKIFIDRYKKHQHILNIENFRAAMKGIGAIAFSLQSSDVERFYRDLHEGKILEKTSFSSIPNV